MSAQVNRNDMRCTAYHEAGHAVAAVVKAISFERVYIIWRADETVGTGGMQLGEVVRNFDKRSLAGNVEEAKRHAMQAFAGPHGETLGYAGLQPDFRSDLDDAASVLKFALCKFKVVGNKPEYDKLDLASKAAQINLLLKQCDEAAYHFVQEQREVIGRVAEELLSRAKANRTRGEMLPDEVAALCQGSSAVGRR